MVQGGFVDKSVTERKSQRMKPSHDPSPAEIEAVCREIQAGWTADERLRRLRSDLRPTYRTADGRRETISGVDYETHHSDNAYERGYCDDLADDDEDTDSEPNGLHAKIGVFP